MGWEKDLHAGQLAICRGLYDEAEKHFLRAEEVAAAFGPGDPAWAEVKKGLARVHLALGRPLEAYKCAQQALTSDELYWGFDCEQIADDCHLAGESLRQLGDYERARPMFERAVAIREQKFGTAHDTTLEVLGKLLVVHLQAKDLTGLEALHAKVFQAYQRSHPSGVWATYLKLHEVGREYISRGELKELQELLQSEATLLRNQIGAHHREVATVLAVEAEVLKQSKQRLAAWKVDTSAQNIARLNNQNLFTADERAYNLPAIQVQEAIHRLLSERPRWVMQPNGPLGQPLTGKTFYNDDVKDETQVAELRISIKITPRGPSCAVLFQCQLVNSSNLNRARTVIAEMLRELDDNILIIKPIAVIPAQSIAATHDATIRTAERGWPTPQQFNEAVQNPSTAFADSSLRHAEAEMNAIGLPKPYSGAFATVYRMHARDHDIAVKCFTTRVPDQQQRYAEISRSLSSLASPYFVDFEYLPDGITIGAGKYPVLRMDWVEGIGLTPYIRQHLRDRECIERLAVSLLEMVGALQAIGIAHGDLQHGNIIIVNEEVRLVDYDGMFVPSLNGGKSNELGHRNYQHPQRTMQHFDASLDSFSIWSIYCSLMCISRAPQFWDLVQAGDECLLFRHDDYLNPEQSNTFRLLGSESDPDVRSTIEFFKKIVSLPLNEVPTVKEVFNRVSR